MCLHRFLARFVCHVKELRLFFSTLLAHKKDETCISERPKINIPKNKIFLAWVRVKNLMQKRKRSFDLTKNPEWHEWRGVDTEIEYWVSAVSMLAEEIWQIAEGLVEDGRPCKSVGSIQEMWKRWFPVWIVTVKKLRWFIVSFHNVESTLRYFPHNVVSKIWIFHNVEITLALGPRAKPINSFGLLSFQNHIISYIGAQTALKLRVIPPNSSFPFSYRSSIPQLPLS